MTLCKTSNLKQLYCSKAKVYGRLVAGVAGSTLARGMDVCLFCCPV
jgi:hypothetical protein